MVEQILYRGLDHANRSWLVTARSGVLAERPAILVTFVCRTLRGTKQLDQTAAWDSAERAWDIQRWFPASPRPVPDAVLHVVQSELLALSWLQEVS